MGELRFIADTHSYLHDGKPISGLTSVMKAEGYINNAFYTEAGRDRGTDVHLACRYYDEGALDWSSVSDEYFAYVEAWAQYREDFKFKPTMIEQPVHSHIYQFATTPDRFGSDKDFKDIMIEIKTGSPVGWWGLQLAAQVIAVHEPLTWAGNSRELVPRSVRRAVQLMPTGVYKVFDYTDRKDYEVVKAMFLIHHDKANRGG